MGGLLELGREKHEKSENLYFLTSCFSFLSLQLCNSYISYRNSYCSMNSLKAFKVACGNQSRLNSTFDIPRGVGAESNSILYHRRHIFIRSCNERKLKQGVKKYKFSYFPCFSLPNSKSPPKKTSSPSLLLRLLRSIRLLCK